MKKVAETAEELDVSRSTVYKYLKKMAEELSPHVEEKDGVTVIAEEGIELIRGEVEKNKRHQSGQQQAESGEKQKQKAEGEREKEDTALEEMQERVNVLEEKLDDLQNQMEEREKRLKEKMNDVVSLTNNLYEFAEDLDEKLTRMEDFERKSMLDRLRDFVAGREE